MPLGTDQPGTRPEPVQTIFRPRSMRRDELVARRRLAELTAPASPILPLPGLAALLRVPTVLVEDLRIELAPAGLPAGLVILALARSDGDEDPIAVLALPLDLARDLIDLALGRSRGRPDQSLSTGEEGALLFVVDRAAGDWLGAGGAHFRIRGILADASQGAEYLRQQPRWQVSATLTAGEIGGQFWVWSLDPSCDCGSPRRVPFAAASDWPIVARICVGAATVGAGELIDLASGDVMLLDVCAHPRGSMSGDFATVVSGGVVRAARWLDHRRLELVSPNNERRSAMDVSSDSAKNVTARLESGRDEESRTLEVLVRVEVGRVTLSLEQAVGLLKGAVLELDRDIGPAVQLYAGDKLVAQGELVDCEGRVAVQITEVP